MSVIAQLRGGPVSTEETGQTVTTLPSPWGLAICFEIIPRLLCILKALLSFCLFNLRQEGGLVQRFYLIESIKTKKQEQILPLSCLRTRKGKVGIIFKGVACALPLFNKNRKQLLYYQLKGRKEGGSEPIIKHGQQGGQREGRIGIAALPLRLRLPQGGGGGCGFKNKESQG